MIITETNPETIFKWRQAADDFYRNSNLSASKSNSEKGFIGEKMLEKHFYDSDIDFERCPMTSYGVDSGDFIIKNKVLDLKTTERAKNFWFEPRFDVPIDYLVIGKLIKFNNSEVTYKVHGAINYDIYKFLGLRPSNFKDKDYCNLQFKTLKPLEDILKCF